MCVRQYIQIHGVAAMNDHSMKKKKKKKKKKNEQRIENRIEIIKKNCFTPEFLK